jgi:hypothetical protein
MSSWRTCTPPAGRAWRELYSVAVRRSGGGTDSLPSVACPGLWESRDSGSSVVRRRRPENPRVRC